MSVAANGKKQTLNRKQQQQHAGRLSQKYKNKNEMQMNERAEKRAKTKKRAFGAAKE